MEVKELLDDFKDEKKPFVSAAAYLGLNPYTIKAWEKKDGQVPRQWEAYYKQLKEDKR